MELNKKFRRFPALISVEGVPELTEISSTAREWRLGAAATLTAVEEALGGEYVSMAKMLALFAGETNPEPRDVGRKSRDGFAHWRQCTGADDIGCIGEAGERDGRALGTVWTNFSPATARLSCGRTR